MVFTKVYARERVDATGRDRPGVSVELFTPKGESPIGGKRPQFHRLIFEKNPQHIQYIKC